MLSTSGSQQSQSSARVHVLQWRLKVCGQKSTTSSWYMQRDGDVNKLIGGVYQGYGRVSRNCTWKRTKRIRTE